MHILFRIHCTRKRGCFIQKCKMSWNQICTAKTQYQRLNTCLEAGQESHGREGWANTAASPYSPDRLHCVFSIHLWKHKAPCLWWFTPALCNFCAKNTAKRWDSLTDDPLHHVIHLSSFLLFFAPSVLHVIHQTQNYTDAYREMQERLVKTLRASPCRKHQLLQKVEANLQGRRELCGSQWRRRVWGDRRRSCGGGWTPVVRFPIRPLWAEQGRHQSTCQETNTPPMNTRKRHTQSDTKGVNVTPWYIYR